MTPAPLHALVQADRLMRAGRPAEALPLARQVVAGLTRCSAAHGLLAAILLDLDHRAEAIAVIAAAAALPDASAAGCDALAHACLRLGRHDDANALYRRATERMPGHAGYWYNLAASERGIGRLDTAEVACDAAIARDEAHAPSYLLRAELRVQTPQANHVEQLRRQLALTAPDAATSVALGYALAKELDDLGEHDEAFHWFATAAAARRRHLAYDVAVDERKIARIIAAFDQPPPAARSRERSPFVFILGLPRSGTTLLERLLSNLPGVSSNGETDNFSRALLAATPPGPDDVFARAARADPVAVADGYARLAGGKDGETIIEKLPMNYLYIGAIRRALPDAALLVLRRPPLDGCFAMFRTLFGDAYPFSYDFDDLARYHAAYARLMAHWGSAPGTALPVDYADLVTAPDVIGARVAAYCGLPWRQEAVAVETNRAASFTASAAQVRRPIYRSSLDRSRHYARHLAPLADALRRYGAAGPADEPL